MFTRERISHFELFDRKAQFVVDKLRERLHEGYPVDFQVEFSLQSFILFTKTFRI